MTIQFGDVRLPDRFWNKVVPEPMSGCWLWVGAVNDLGYGQIRIAGKCVRPHRLSYSVEEVIPPDLVMDHLCRTPSCCNPSHLEPVTRRENIMRGDNPDMMRARFAAQTHCKRGHELSGDNLRRWPRIPKYRICRECKNQLQRSRRASGGQQEKP